MSELLTNYLDDILAAAMNGKRKYRITHSNGLFEDVTIEDVSEYDQIGSTFGAGDINKINQAVNEKFDSDDVVDPMLTTEKGFAADAYKTKVQLEKVQSDLEQVFQLGANRKAQIISSLQNTNLGLTIDSSWDEIVAGLAQQFPSSYDILAMSYEKWTIVSKVLSSYGYLNINADKIQWHDQSDSETAHKFEIISPEFDITNFNTIQTITSFSSSSSGGSKWGRITLNVPGLDPIRISNNSKQEVTDISAYSGLCTITVSALGSYAYGDYTVLGIKLFV